MSVDKLNEIFDVTPVEVISPDGRTTTIVPEGAEDEDHQYARARHYELAETGAEALGIAMRILRESESPQAIKELSGLIKSLSDVNKSLLGLNKDKADVKTAKQGGGNKPSVGGGTPSVQQNIIFAGSSKDLDKLIADKLAGK